MFQLDPKSGKSIYEQVIDNLKGMIMTGELKEGEKLPSVRDLSRLITVNPNTIQKAYRELERQGYTYTQAGLGTFVSDKTRLSVDPLELKRAVDRLEDSLRQLTYLGLKQEQIDEIISELKGKMNEKREWGEER